MLVETEQCPLNESVDLTTHHIDSGGRTGKFTSGLFADWHKTQQQNPTIKLAIQYFLSSGSKPAPQVLANPVYDASYLKDQDKAGPITFKMIPVLYSEEEEESCIYVMTYCTVLV